MSKKKKSEKPDVPAAQSFDESKLKQPATSEDFTKMMDEMQARYPEIYEDILQKQLQYAPALTEADRQYQTALYNNAVQLGLTSAPQYAALESQMVNQYAPQFGQTYAALGQNINQGLASGYNLGPDLSREVEQSIRGAQTARGNYLGPAATAQEAMGTGQASIELYNQRIAAAQNYLQGNNPVSMMGQIGSATNLGQQYYPGQTVNTGATAAMTGSAAGTAASAYGVQSQSASNFNSALLGAFGQNSQNVYNSYDRSYEQYLEQQAVAHGLYDQPMVGATGSSGAMQLAGAGIGAIGAIGGGLLVF
jgi:hypothetical protein